MLTDKNALSDELARLRTIAYIGGNDNNFLEHPRVKAFYEGYKFGLNPDNVEGMKVFLYDLLEEILPSTIKRIKQLGTMGIGIVVNENKYQDWEESFSGKEEEKEVFEKIVEFAKAPKLKEDSKVTKRVKKKSKKKDKSSKN